MAHLATHFFLSAMFLQKRMLKKCGRTCRHSHATRAHTLPASSFRLVDISRAQIFNIRMQVQSKHRFPACAICHHQREHLSPHSGTLHSAFTAHHVTPARTKNNFFTARRWILRLACARIVLCQYLPGQRLFADTMLIPPRHQAVFGFRSPQAIFSKTKAPGRQRAAVAC
jgi:hypothetical protein